MRLTILEEHLYVLTEAFLESGRLLIGQRPWPKPVWRLFIANTIPHGLAGGNNLITGKYGVKSGPRFGAKHT